LEGYEDSFGGGDASRAGEAVGQRDLCGGESLGRFVFQNDFIGVLSVYVSFGGAQLVDRGRRYIFRGCCGECFNGLDACDSGGDEVVQIIGAQDSTHGLFLSLFLYFTEGVVRIMEGSGGFQY
jgi:hypothetical protein